MRARRPSVTYYCVVRATRGRRRALGQHWLVDKRVLGRIARAADFTPQDTVIEVGAGTGLLTDLLAQRATRLIAVEIDPALAARLGERFAGRDNVSVIEADALDLTAEQVLAVGGGGLPYVVVGNLPYSAGSAIVRHFLTDRAPPSWLLVTLQAEVARNMAAEPGHMSYLSVETQYFAEPRLLFEAPPRAFRPPPKVTSAVLRLDVRGGPGMEVDDREAFFRFAQAGFAAPRKHLRNALAIGLRCETGEAERLLAEAGIDPQRRAQTLTLEEWGALYRAYAGSGALSR